jgi:hypothetical protein
MLSLISIEAVHQATVAASNVTVPISAISLHVATFIEYQEIMLV